MLSFAVQVVAMRLPLESVLPHLPAILDGVLLWAADSKNKFKLKVLVRPCSQQLVRC